MRYLKLVSFFVIIQILISVLFSISVFALERVNLNLTYDGIVHQYDNYKLTLTINGDHVDDLPLQPVIINNYTYVPVKEIFTKLGAVVDWKDSTKEIYIGKDDKLIILKIGSNVVNNNGQIVLVPDTPRIINSKTMVPVRFVIEAFGYSVEWIDETKTVSIDTNLIAENQNQPVETNTPVTPVSDSSSGYTSNLTENDATDVSASKPIALDPAIDVSKSVILEMKHPETQITSIEKLSSSYVIHASSEISRVDKLLLEDNRFILDIHNAEMQLPSKIINTDGNPYLSSIRAAQNQVTPNLITRIVFDLKESVSFSVTLSQDRKSINFSFEKNYITNVTFDTDGSNDIIRIEGTATPVVSVYPLSNPARLVIDLPYSTMFSKTSIDVNGSFATSVRTSQYEEEASRVVVDMRDQPEYTITNEHNVTIIKLAKPNYQNIFYDSATKTITIRKPASGNLTAASITEIDKYNNYQYDLMFSEDLSGHLGHGEMVIKDDYLNSLEIYNELGRTIVSINEMRVLATQITEDSNSIYVKLLLPREIYKNIIVLDAGHGAKDQGASGNGLIEKNLTLDITQKIISLIEADKLIKVYATRVDDVYPDLASRAAFANEIGDVFVSVHINSFTNSTKNGTETWFYKHDNDAALGFSSQTFASMMQKNMIDALKTVDRGHKSEAFVVLKQTKIPAVLCEIEFLSNPEAAAKLADDSFKMTAAQSIYKTILEVFNVYTPKR